jgi:hypothetical protein
MLDIYFRRPIFWDYLIAILLTSLVTLLSYKKKIDIPSGEHLYSIVSDLTTISLTMAGFILTLLTVLISFKSTSRSKKDFSEKDSLFEIFFSTNLYYETIMHLKNAIISLSVISVIGYIFKLSITSKYYHVLFSYNMLGIIIIFFTVWRSLLILSKIIKIQKGE